MTDPEAPALRSRTGTGRIRWEGDGHGGFAGYVGTLEPWAFQLWQSPCDTGNYVLGDWVRLAAFPRADGTRSVSGKDPDVLKAEAERWLEEFVTSLGAVFPAEPPMVCTTCRKPVRKVPGTWAPSVWDHAEAADGRACPGLGAHLTGTPIMAMAAPTSGTTPATAGEKE